MGDYTKTIKGITDTVISAVDTNGDPSVADVDCFPFAHLGFQDDAVGKISAQEITKREGGGSTLQLAHEYDVRMNSLEVDSGTHSMLEKFKNKRTDFFLFGGQQSHRIKTVYPNISINAELNPKGKKVTTIGGGDLVDTLANKEELNNSATFYSARNEYKFLQVWKSIPKDGLQLALLPHLGNFGVTDKIYDASNNRYKGTVYNNASWVTPYIGFDGVSQYASLGDILNDDPAIDYAIILWVRLTDVNVGAGILNKGPRDIPPGIVFHHYPDSGLFFLSDGIQSGQMNCMLTSGTWQMVSVFITRVGNSSTWLNQDQVYTKDFSLFGSGSNSANFELGRTSLGYGNIRMGIVASYHYPPGTFSGAVSPSDLAARIFAATRSIYGV